jgi:outer membrane protein assembly factor BamB
MRARRLAALLAAAASMAMATGCWWQPGANANRNGHNALESAISIDTVGDLAETWSASTALLRSPVIVGDVVYVADGSWWARRISTGEPIWSVPENRGNALYFTGRHLLLQVGDGAFSSAYEIDRQTGQNAGPDGLFLPGRLDSVRGSTLAGRLLPDWVDTTPITWLQVGDAMVPERNWRARLHPGHDIDPPVTVGAEDVFVAGVGYLSTDPTSTATGLSLRAYTLDGVHADCAELDVGGFPTPFTCPRIAVPLAGTVATSPVLSEPSTVLVGTDAGVLYAVDIGTGALAWTASVGSAVTAPPVVAGGMVLVPTAASGLVALPRDGCGAAECVPMWSTSTSAAITVQPAAAGGAVFVSAANGTVEAFPVAGCGQAVCSPAWGVDLGQTTTGEIAVGSGHLFASVDRTMHVFAPATG